MFWGFIVAAAEEPIVFIPSLDQSETPNSLPKVFKQLASWFKGPFLAFRYRSFLKHHYRSIYERRPYRVNGLTAFAVGDGLNWLLTSTLLYFYVIMALWYGVLIWLPLLVFLVTYQYGVLIILKRFVPAGRISFTEQGLVLLAGWVVLLLHSVPAYYSLLLLLRGSEAVNKTER